MEPEDAKQRLNEIRNVVSEAEHEFMLLVSKQPNSEWTEVILEVRGKITEIRRVMDNLAEVLPLSSPETSSNVARGSTTAVQKEETLWKNAMTTLRNLLPELLELINRTLGKLRL